MKRTAVKSFVAKSPRIVKRLMRNLVILPVRTYFRYVPFTFGKKLLWNKIASHLWWLESYAKAETIFGSTLRVDARDLVGRYIYYFGVWEPNLTEWIRQRLLPGDVFIDVGANIGYYSLLASKLVGKSGKVVAIEALPQIFRLLERNLMANNARNVRPVNIAAWDKDETIRVFTDRDSLVGTTTAMPTWANKWQLEAQYELPAAPLSTVLTQDEFEAARLIKIDVEGAEWHVISGLQSLMHTCRKDLEIMVEVAPKILEEGGRTAQDMVDCFRQWGFHPYQIVNNYSGSAYFSGLPSRPERIERIPTVTAQTDVVFSRIDAAFL